MKLNELKQNVSVEQAGVWLDYGGGLEVKLCRMPNTRFSEMLQECLAGAVSRKRRGSIDKAILNKTEDAQRQAFARHVLVDWSGLQDEDGNAVPYSEGKALEIISDPAYHDFYEDLLDMARDRSNFEEGVEEEAQENL